MKLIEALHELRILEKKMTRNNEYIGRYSSMVSTQVPAFNTQEEQREKVRSLLQENVDYAMRRILLKSQINYTNLMTWVNLGGKMWRLQNLLDFQRGVALEIRNTFASLSEHSGQSQLRNAPTIEGRSPQVVRLYDENMKLTELDRWDTVKEEIRTRLEVINAVTDLLELPGVTIETEEENAKKWDSIPTTQLNSNG